MATGSPNWFHSRGGVLEVITSHRLSSVQASTSRPITGKVQRNLVGSNCDDVTVWTTRDGCRMRQMGCHRDGTGRDSRHVGPAYATCGLDARHLQLDLVKLHCRKITWCMEKSKEVNTQYMSLFYFLLPLHECNYEHSFLTSKSTIISWYNASMLYSYKR